MHTYFSIIHFIIHLRSKAWAWVNSSCVFPSLLWCIRLSLDSIGTKTWLATQHSNAGCSVGMESVNEADSAHNDVWCDVSCRLRHCCTATNRNSSLAQEPDTLATETTSLGPAQASGARKTGLPDSASDDRKPLAGLPQGRWRHPEEAEADGQSARVALRQRFAENFAPKCCFEKKIVFLLGQSSDKLFQHYLKIVA